MVSKGSNQPSDLISRFEFTDPNKDEQLRLEFEGVHFISNGSLYGFAEPSGSLIDIRELPSLVPASHQNDTANLILPELSARIQKLRKLIYSGTVEDSSSSSSTSSQSSCPFSVYAQLEPTDLSEEEMKELEEETLRPTGAGVRKRPEMRLNVVLASRACGLVVKMGETEGLRTVTFFGKITTYAGFAACVYLGLLLLLSRQMDMARTPAALARISRWSFFAQALADSISFASHITFAILAEGRPSLTLVAPAFLACILFSNEVQFAMLIYSVQAPEDAVVRTTPPAPAATAAPAASLALTQTPDPARTRARALALGGDSSRSPDPLPTVGSTTILNSDSDDNAGTPTQDASNISPSDNVAEPASGGETGGAGRPAATATPTPAPAPPPATTVTPPPRVSFWRMSWDILRNDNQTRTWLFMFILVTLVVRLLLAPSLGLMCFALLYGSIWVPQIVRAARRGRSCALEGRYLVGTTLGRLAIAGYYLIYPDNVLDVTPRPWMYPLILLMFAQVAFIKVQDVLGPAFFLPNGMSETQTYDYHPPLPTPDAEAPEASLGDCAICMDAIHPTRHAQTPSAEEEKGLLSGVSSNSGGITGNSGLAGLWNVVNGTARERAHAVAMRGRGRKNYSLAPCHHLFHTECLERWLAIKNICPQCRRPLPPL